MKGMRQLALCSFALVLLWFSSIPVLAQEYQPSVGQEGKDVIWVPTPDALIQAMLDVAKVTSNDFVIDLGSGDGRIVIAAAKRGAHTTGFEFNPDMVALSRRNAEKEGVSDKATFVNADLFESDFSKATVITMYLLPRLNLKLRPIILELKPGTRVVSHAFSMGEWNPDQTVEQDGRTAYLWIVPAKVTGKWIVRTASGTGELDLTQEFQTVQGTLKLNGQDTPITNGKLDGSKIIFRAGNREYSGVLRDTGIAGSVKTEAAEENWSAEISK